MTNDLQVKFLLGECNPEEMEQVEAWINAGAANQKEFEKLKILWEESRDISRQSTVDADEAWERFRKLREEKDRGALAGQSGSY